MTASSSTVPCSRTSACYAIWLSLAGGPLGSARGASAGASTRRLRYTMAASTLMLVPVLILFVVANKYFVRGIATSGLAGR